jgi:hypothetical protein
LDRLANAIDCGIIIFVMFGRQQLSPSPPAFKSHDERGPMDTVQIGPFACDASDPVYRHGAIIYLVAVLLESGSPPDILCPPTLSAFIALAARVMAARVPPVESVVSRRTQANQGNEINRRLPDVGANCDAAPTVSFVAVVSLVKAATHHGRVTLTR